MLMGTMKSGSALVADVVVAGIPTSVKRAEFVSVPVVDPLLIQTRSTVAAVFCDGFAFNRISRRYPPLVASAVYTR